jgi:hypothetical protein
MLAWRDYLGTTDDAAQLQLFDPSASDVQWPAMERFPHNRPRHHVAQVVFGDLHASEQPLIVAGYSALGELLRLVAAVTEKQKCIRILFGEEPFQTSRTRFVLGRNSFADEVREHWLERGISLRLSGAVVRAKELITAQRLVTRLQRAHQELHAKIYVGDNAATIGSSNFTDPGLRRKREGNARFTKHGESKRYEETRSLAEIYWTGGEDYSDDLHQLLDELLQKVGWRHALARACAELLEGRWATDRYRLPSDWETVAPLWPTQSTGIAQALWVMENAGSVLVADAAGSGKTRLGAHLTAAIRRHLFTHGRAHVQDPLISCPPDAVLEKWRDELARCGLTATTPFSHGVLSNQTAADSPRAQHAIQRAPILIIDEAHNFHNPGSNRTRAILGNMADHKVLLTATPVSRPHDLLATIDLLGADNFDDESLEMIESMLGGRARHAIELSKEDVARLKTEIARFTVRRTRSMLNAAIAREPDKYCNDEGVRCRYPKHEPRYYSCGEPADFLRVAKAVRERASQLRGLLFLVKPLELPADLEEEGFDEPRYVTMRLRAARGLARYQVMATFRSSRAALYEHVYGTDAAAATFELAGLAKAESGDVVRRLQMLDAPPDRRVSCDLPSWLSDASEYRRAVADEVEIYKAIAACTRDLAAVREDAKARVLAQLAQEHDSVLAFDSRPISLADLQRRVRLLTDKPVLLAIGGDVQGRRRVTEHLHRRSQEDSIIALCSDSMAEGFNLQRASAIMNLDMPAVIRIAEQRVGRVDRMDSPHDAIVAYWPRDPSEIALRADERLAANNEFVDQILGANLVLPSDEPRDRDVVSPETLVAELQRPEEEWNDDAFSPVRSMVDGSSALVPAAVYEEVRTSKARLVSAVSVVRSERPWAFLAVGATERSAPRWVYLDSPTSDPVMALHDVAAALRARLDKDTPDADFDDRANDRLAEFLQHLQACERKLLPRLKQRALEQMERIVIHYLEHTPPSDYVRTTALRELLQLVGPLSSFDLASVAQSWLEAIRPVRYRWLQKRTRRRTFARLRELDGDLRDQPLTTEMLRDAFSDLLGARPLDERIVAVIVGVP